MTDKPVVISISDKLLARKLIRNGDFKGLRKLKGPMSSYFTKSEMKKYLK
tara:strand:+ start:510 stop:659 length:150 start_codon:yes stop_codon:yes gene_type:complete